jgi:guanyl-specific ribonuclease Sa
MHTKEQAITKTVRTAALSAANSEARSCKESSPSGSGLNLDCGSLSSAHVEPESNDAIIREHNGRLFQYPIDILCG